MNRALRRISLACLVMFVLLLVNANYVQAFEANNLAGKPGNARTFSQQFQYQRGAIVTADNKTIAESVPVKGIYKYQRHYPYGPLYAPVTGFNSIYSATGIEQAENRQLSGSDPALAVHNLLDLISGKPKRGATVQLTINSAAQQAAYAGLKATGLQGGVVALDPQTGAVLAMASYPTFDPNLLATFDGTALNKIDKQLLADPSQPLTNKAINQTFPPGSTFKIVTSSTAFSTGKYTPDTRVYAPTNLKLPDTTNQLINFDGEACNDGSNPTGNGKVPTHLRVHRLLQHRVRQPGHEPGRGRLAGAGRQVRHERPEPDHPAAGFAEQLPAGVDTRLHRLLGDRPVQRHGDTAAGGDVLRRHREQRHPDEALHGPEDHRAGPDPA